MSDPKRISRRQALAHLGLGMAAVYSTPQILGISMAQASGSSSTPPTPPTPPTAPSSISSASGPSGSDAMCRISGSSGEMTITQREYELAQAAIARGKALPLGHVMSMVNGVYPGRIARVGFISYRQIPSYTLQVIKAGGQVNSLVVEAATGTVLKVMGC